MQRLPIYYLLLDSAFQESPIESLGKKYGSVEIMSDHCYKFYSIRGMIKRQDYQLELLNEYVITKSARERGLQNVIPLLHSVKGDDHFGLVLPRYSMTLEYYLTHYRRAEKLPLIME